MSYDRDHDTFIKMYLIGPSAVIALVVTHHYSLIEVLWTFSVVLESVAILPQLFLLTRTGEAEALTSEYIACLGGYRALYLLNWVYRAYIGHARMHWFVWFFGILQTLLYADFFYVYFRSRYYGTKLRLPK